MKIKKRLFLEPTTNKWESRAVLNPTAIKEKGTTHLFYRAVDKDWISSIGYAKITNNKVERENTPLISPTEDYEIKGIEDPRITKIGNTYYILYTAFDGKNARIAYATSKNLRDWKKKGIISPNIPTKKAMDLIKIRKYREVWKCQNVTGKGFFLWDKDAVLFPEKINGKYVMLHRFMPDMQIVKFKNFLELQDNSFWNDYLKNIGSHIFMHRKHEWESLRIGAGAVPIKTKQGWLLIYHGIGFSDKKSYSDSINKDICKIESIGGKRNTVYRAGVALFENKYPQREIKRLEKPLFEPDLKWEKEGDIGNVVFPEGVTLEGNKLKIYYGCSDSRIGLAEVNFKQLIKKLTPST